MAKARDHKTTYAARNARAKAAGFRSYAEQRKYRKALKASPYGTVWGKKPPAVTKAQADTILDPASTDMQKITAIVQGETGRKEDERREAWRKFREEYRRRKAQAA